MALLVIGCANLKNSTSNTKAGNWATVTSKDGSKPIARHEAAFVRIKNKFYLLGGRGIRPVSIFDTATQSWSEGSKPPLEMHHFQPVVYKDKVYILGAMTGGYPGEVPVPYIYIYDPSTDAWSKGDKIPEDRLRGSTGNVLYNDKIFIACGIKDGHRSDHKKWLDSYDPQTGKWEILPNAPRARDHFQAEVINNKIYVLAGRRSMAPDETFKHTLAEIDVFDLAKKKWETLPTVLPTHRAGNMVVANGNELWVIGGESEGSSVAHNEVEALNVNSNSWRTLPPLVRGRHGSGIIKFDEALYVASGSGNKGGSPELESMEKYYE